MSKIKIKNFGPIKAGYQENDGWLDIKKVTVFIGNQGSGKSTVAKLISTFTWIEKVLVRGDYNTKWFDKKNKLKSLLRFHRLENFFSKNSEIEYQGYAYQIKYKNDFLIINEIESYTYALPQIMYVPSERNFIANVKTPKALKLTSDSLIEFVTEFDNVKEQMKGAMKLPINNVSVEYDRLNDTVNIKGNTKGEEYKLKLTDASSGFHSLVPMYLVSWYLSNLVDSTDNSNTSSEELERFRKSAEEILNSKNLTEDQKRISISILASKFNKKAFINIVEEPEQNLFPSSQGEMLWSLLEFNKMLEGNNKLIMTTHSPYIISYLTLAVKAHDVFIKLHINEVIKFTDKIIAIVPKKSFINPNDLVIYELDNSGNIIKLDDYNGLPSDNNYLNEGLALTNSLFAKLLEIEDLCLTTS